MGTQAEITPDDYDKENVHDVHFPDGTIVQFLDTDGTHLSLDFFLERKVPGLETLLKNAKHFPCRQDDVFILAFMKAGTHWVWEVCQMLVSGKAEYVPNSKESAMIEFQSHKDLEAFDSPRILNSHLLPNQLPNDILKLKNRIIFIQRNPKDISVSAYHHLTKLHHFKCSFSAFLKVFEDNVVLFHNWFHYTATMEEALTCTYKDSPILQLRYEDLKRNGFKEIKRIADFLEVDVSEEFIHLVQKKCGFDEMSNAKTELAELKQDKIQKSMYRKGQIGDWKNWFNVAENEEFDKKFHDRMKNVFLCMGLIVIHIHKILFQMLKLKFVVFF